MDLPFHGTQTGKTTEDPVWTYLFHGTQSGETSRTSSADFHGTQSGKTTEHPVRTYLFHGTQSGHTWADVAVTARPYTGLAGNVYPKERCPGLQHNVSLHLSRTKNNNDNVYWDCQVSLLLHLLRRVELLCYYIFYAESRIAKT